MGRVSRGEWGGVKKHKGKQRCDVYVEIKEINLFVESDFKFSFPSFFILRYIIQKFARYTWKERKVLNILEKKDII